MADDFDAADNPDWTTAKIKPLDTAAKLQLLRGRIEMNQADFADLLAIPVATLRNWEQRRTRPDPAAVTLIELIYQDPEGMRERLLRSKAA